MSLRVSHFKGIIEFFHSKEGGLDSTRSNEKVSFLRFTWFNNHEVLFICECVDKILFAFAISIAFKVEEVNEVFF